MSKLFLHAGARDFSRDTFLPVVQTIREYNKPYGGLWGSPMSSRHSWLKYMATSSEMWHRRNMYDQSIGFKFRVTGNVLVIDSLEDSDRLARQYPEEGDEVFAARDIGIDWLRFATDAKHDAVYLTARGYAAHRCATNGNGLFTRWDCESIVVLNPDAVRVVSRNVTTNWSRLYIQ